MLSSLLTTKLYIPPARAALVPRPRLVERLQQGLQGPFTLLSSPPGSGKTSLLSEWRLGPGAGAPLAWLSLDEADNDPIRFFHHLLASLDVLQPGLLAELLPLLQTSELPRPEILLTPLINTLSSYPRDFILALDDYHAIETPLIHNGLVFLLDHLPPRLHLVLLTRADPPLPLARLRARGQMVEIRSEHLRFSLTEAARFLDQVMGLALNPDQVEALEKRTEGWIAGLQLAALSMQGRQDVDGFIAAFTGSNHYIVDYLAEEVLERQPEPMRNFLLQTSILERLTGSLCDAVTGASGSAQVLESLEHANLFVIPLDKEQRWYRFHALFADLLRSRLLHSQPAFVGLLHGRASAWFEENGMLDEAIEHAMAAKDYPRASGLFCTDCLEVIYNRSMTTLERWLQAFPREFLLEDPRLCIARGHALWAEGRRNELEPYVNGARASLEKWLASGRLVEGSREARVLQGEVLIFQSFLARIKREHEQAAELSCQALELLPEDARSRAYALGSLYMVYQSIGDYDRAAQVTADAVQVARQLDYPSMHATAAVSLALILRIQGKFTQATAVLREALEHADRKGQSRLFYNGGLHIGLAESFYVTNDLDAMEAELNAGLAICRQGGMSILVVIGLFDVVALHYARRDLQKALATLDDIERDCREMDPDVYREDCQLCHLHFQVEQGDYSGVEAYLKSADLTVRKKLSTGAYSRLLMAALLLQFLGRLDESLELLGKIEAVLVRDKLEGLIVQVWALQALGWEKKQDEARAFACLDRLVELAEKQDNLGCFIELGEPMQALLQRYSRQGQVSPFVERLLSGFESTLLGKTTTPLPTPDILSRRERELLTLVAAGCSNKEIAVQLVISLGTVKRHTVNIFNKLGVKNRTEAVARARELKLL